ncbi:g6770 [Coccomyxa viridis]|uniref:G6770 protein n=1 Tax=Coccomyxa viridis TaxID=1274662 RepID=A0ABP1G142_9CHLO
MRFITSLCGVLCLASSIYAESPRIAISRTATQIKEEWEQVAMQNIIDYAELHRYHLQLSGHVDKDRHPAWSKVKAWQHLLQRYDWVWQTDADMAILDMHRRLETFLDSDYDIIIGRDCSTFHDLLDHGFNASEALRASVNTGSFFLRSSPWTSEFLCKLYEYNGSHIPNIDIWWDNAAMIHFIQMDQSLDTHIKLLPGRLFNAWPPSTTHYFRERNVSHLCDHTETVFYEPGEATVAVRPGPSDGPA